MHPARPENINQQWNVIKQYRNSQRQYSYFLYFKDELPTFSLHLSDKYIIKHLWISASWGHKNKLQTKVLVSVKIVGLHQQAKHYLL